MWLGVFESSVVNGILILKIGREGVEGGKKKAASGQGLLLRGCSARIKRSLPRAVALAD